MMVFVMFSPSFLADLSAPEMGGGGGGEGFEWVEWVEGWVGWFEDGWDGLKMGGVV